MKKGSYSPFFPRAYRERRTAIYRDTQCVSRAVPVCTAMANAMPYFVKSLAISIPTKG